MFRSRSGRMPVVAQMYLRVQRSAGGMPILTKEQQLTILLHQSTRLVQSTLRRWQSASPASNVLWCTPTAVQSTPKAQQYCMMFHLDLKLAALQMAKVKILWVQPDSLSSPILIAVSPFAPQLYTLGINPLFRGFDEGHRSRLGVEDPYEQSTGQIADCDGG